MTSSLKPHERFCRRGARRLEESALEGIERSKPQSKYRLPCGQRRGAPTQLQSQTEQQHQLDNGEAHGLGHRGPRGRAAVFLLELHRGKGSGILKVTEPIAMSLSPGIRQGCLRHSEDSSDSICLDFSQMNNHCHRHRGLAGSGSVQGSTPDPALVDFTFSPRGQDASPCRPPEAHRYKALVENVTLGAG